MAREDQIRVRVSGDEKRAIEKAAAEDSRTVSDFIRLTVLQKIGFKPKLNARGKRKK